MDQLTYDKIKAQLDAVYHKNMENLESLRAYFGTNLPVAASASTVKWVAPPASRAAKKPIVRLAKGTMLTTPKKSINQETTEVGSRNLAREAATVKCEHPGCNHRVHAGNPPCESCTKKICSVHKRGSVCVACKETDK